jgi:hypothetical protein
MADTRLAADPRQTISQAKATHKARKIKALLRPHEAMGRLVGWRKALGNSYFNSLLDKMAERESAEHLL